MAAEARSSGSFSPKQAWGGEEPAPSTPSKLGSWKAAKVAPEGIPMTPKGASGGVTLESINAMNENKDNEALAKFQGASGLASSLNTDLLHGLSEEQVEISRQTYGANVFPSRPPPSFLSMLWEAMKDLMIIILFTVALITIILGAAIPEQRAHQAWSEGLAVLGTALIVVFIGAGQDYGKELQFQKLNALKDAIEIKVVRNGKQIVVPNTDLVVGDVMLLDTGDKISADGIVVEAQGLVIDEASLTGESDPIKKDAEQDPWCRSGTSVNEGSGRMLVTAVGFNSEWGKTMALVSEAGDDMTPLQEQLKDLATKISKWGVAAAVVCFLALLIKWLIVNDGGDIDKINDNGPLQFLLYAITITVVSIPEGLPLAVTLTLAYSMKKMMKDNNFVRVLSACETMGGATAICSDKTGTLTENRMTVVEGWFAGTEHATVPAPEAMSPAMHTLLLANAALNSKAFLVDQPTGVTDFVGNRTECALLVLIRKLGHKYEEVREARRDDVVRVFGFSSARKMATVVVREPGAGGCGLRVYNKGAAEWVLKKCSHVMTEGGVQDMTEAKLQELLTVVENMAKRGLRCICMAYRDLPAPAPSAEFLDDPNNLVDDLTVYCIVGIKDPVRQEVPHAVEVCQKAGVTVRMVTGDNIHTARHIARECGIYFEEEGHVALEGPVFRVMPASELIPMLPNLRVLARSSPEDKLTLVRMLKQQGEVVAVTGDGTNDAPALKESNVGLAMGIAGTEVAKEAADIIILDDNFGSIVKSVLWGRCVFMNIRKFLVFQLSVNLVAMISAAVGAIAGGVPPLNVLQLLWVNMIMDTLAALALATEDPYPELLDDPPHGRHESLITGLMWMHIVVGAVYKMFWLFLCLYALPVSGIQRYDVMSKTEYYQETGVKDGVVIPTINCMEFMVDEEKDPQQVGLIDEVCNAMAFCSFPVGSPVERENPALCWLKAGYPTSALPYNPREAMCPGTKDECELYKVWKEHDEDFKKEWDRANLKEYKPALSVLFNSFIMAQIFNAFVSRRIGLECDFFKNILHSPIFLGIMLSIFVLQVIIMQTPIAYVFKVQPLIWEEWLACIAIGVGVIPYSWVVRLTVRGFKRCGCTGDDFIRTLRGKRVVPKENSGGNGSGKFRGGGQGSMRISGSIKMNGRTGSGRTTSGAAGGARTASGR